MMENPQKVHSDYLLTRATAADDFSPSATPIHKPAISREGDESSCESLLTRKTQSIMSETQEGYDGHSTFDKDGEELNLVEFEAFSHEGLHVVMANAIRSELDDLRAQAQARVEEDEALKNELATLRQQLTDKRKRDESSCGSLLTRKTQSSVMSETQQEGYESHSSFDKDEEEPKPDEFEPSSHEGRHVVMAHHDCTASPLKPIIRCDDTKLEYVEVKRIWRRLPKIDLNTIQKQRINLRDRSVLQEGVRFARAHRGMNVVFDSVKIRNYSQTIGDNPSVSYGPPIQLDWDYEDGAPVPIDEYECERRFRRRQIQALALNYYQRCNVLTYYCGVSETEIKTAQKEAEKIIRQRNFTTMTLPFMIVEDMLESAGRKAKRLQTSIFWNCAS
jgi:regulator of replication initiation timing